jgi:beta-lactamase class A
MSVHRSSLQQQVESVLARVPQVDWGVCIRHDGAEVVSWHADRVLPSASMGKVLLLLAAAHLLATGEREADEPLVLQDDDRVADSGLWQYLPERTLTWQGACVLVGAVSDNCAANALLREIGLPQVQQVSADLGLPLTVMADRLRDVRTADDPPAPSVARAQDLAVLLERLGDAGPDWPEGALVRSWLALNTDLSMVASAWALDPLAHAALPGGWLINKTGTDVGVRADAGALASGAQRWSYAVLAHGESAEWDAPVVRAMRDIGALIAGRAPLA